MDIEQLKLILEVVGNAGEGAYTVGLIYFLQPYFSSIMTFFGFSLFGFFAYKIARFLTTTFSVIGEIGRISGTNFDYVSERSHFLRKLSESYKD